MVMVKLLIVKVKFTREIGSMDKKKVKAFIITSIIHIIKADGKMISRVDLVYSNIKIKLKIFMKATGSTDIKVDTVNKYIPMEICIILSIIFIYKNRYEGEWNKDKRNGIGKLTMNNKDVYIGEWEEDIKNGKGEYKFADFKEKYEGYWLKG